MSNQKEKNSDNNRFYKIQKSFKKATSSIPWAKFKKKTKSLLYKLVPKDLQKEHRFVKITILGFSSLYLLCVFPLVLLYFINIYKVLTAQPQNLSLDFSPQVTSASIINGAEDVSLDEEIYLTFTEKPDLELIQEELNKDLGEEIKLELSQNTIKISHNDGWEPDRTYQIDLSATDFNFLDNDFFLVFDSVRTPKVELTNFENGISSQEELLISFNTNIFKDVNADITDFIEFEPNISGKSEILTASSLRFVPQEALEIGKTYEIRISAEKVHNEFGLGMKKDYIAQFTPGEDKVNQLDTIGFIKGFNGDVKARTRDKIVVIMDSDVDKVTFRANAKIYKSDNLIIPYEVIWSTSIYSKLEEKYNLYDYPTPSEDKEYRVASIIPKENWIDGKEYSFFISKDLHNQYGQTMTYDYERSITVPSEFNLIESNIKDGILDGNEKSEYAAGIVKFTFTNEMIYSTKELSDLIFVKSLTGMKGELNSYIYIPSYKQDEIHIEADFRDENVYEINISEGLTDRFGNRLNDDIKVEFEVKNVAPPSELNIFGNQTAYVDANDEYRVLLESMNLNNIQIEIIKITPEDLIAIKSKDNQKQKMKIAFRKDKVVKSWTKIFDDFDNENVRYKMSQFQYPLNNIANGIYIVRAFSQDHKYRDFRILIVSEYVSVMKHTEDTVLVWNVNTNSADPLVGKNLKLKSGKNTIESKTDQSGVVQFNQQMLIEPIYVYSEDGDIFVSSSYDRGLEYYGAYGSYGSQRDKVYQVYFDRPIYKKGQNVHFKIFARKKEERGLSIPSGEIPVEIRDSTNSPIYSDNLELSEFGTANDSLKLSDKLNSGKYDLYIDNRYIGNFRISAYKVFNYSFIASIQDDKEFYKDGDNVNMEVEARYYFGKPLANANVEVNLYARDLYDNYYVENLNEEYKKYSFPTRYTFDNYNQYNSIKIGSATTRTDEYGFTNLKVPINVPSQIAYSLAKYVSIEVKVRDEMGNEEYQTFYKVLAPKGGVVGIDNKQYYGSIGEKEPFKAQAVFLDEDLKPRSNKNVVIRVNRIDNRQVKRRRENGVYYWENIYEEVEVFSTIGMTNSNGVIDFEYLPDIEGRYEVEFFSESNRKIYNRTSFYVFAQGSYSYYPFYQDDIKAGLKPDKEEYKIGDKARLLPELPHSNYKALVTIERGDIYDWEVIDLRNVDGFITKISDKFIPNFYYSFFAFVPHDWQKGFLDFKLGTQKIKVETSQKQIDTSISTNKEEYHPQETVNVSLRTTGNQEVEYLIAVVDKAVLDLAKVDHNKDLADYMTDSFWTDWGLDVETASNLSIYENKLMAEKKWGNKGGSGGGSRASDFDLQSEDIRKDFKDVALWRPHNVTENGNFNFKFELPDNLTTWSIIAIGITKDSSFAVAEKEILVSKDVNIVPQIPSYLIKGDTVKVVYDAVFEPDFLSETTVKLEVDNGTVKCNDEYLQVCLYEVSKENFPIEYEYIPVNTGEATLNFSIHKDEKVLDAEERVIEIQSDTIEREKLFFGETKNEQSVNFTFPKGHEISEKNLKILLSDRVVGDLDTMKSYFMNYENKCSEQTSSTLLGLIPYADQQKVKENIDEGIQRLYVLQNNDGGWGVWENSKSNPFNSIYSYYALRELERIDIEVNDKRLKRAQNYMQNNINEMGSEKLFAWSILSEDDYFDIGGVNNYFNKNRNNLTLLSRVYLLETYFNYFHSDKIATKEREEIKNKIELLSYSILEERKSIKGKTYWQDDKVLNSYFYNNDLKTTAIILETLVKIFGPDPRLIPVINYLKYEVENNRYMGTQSTLYVVKALRTAKKVYRLDLEYARPVIEVNGKEYTKFKREEEGLVLEVTLPKSESDLNIYVDSKNESLFFYQVKLEYQIPMQNISSKDNGVAVATRFYDMNDNQLFPDEGRINFRLGNLYKVKTYVFTKEDLGQSEIRIPIPAGLKPVDFNLNLTSNELFENLKEENEQRRFLANLSINQDDVVFYTGDTIYNTHMRRGVYTFVFYARAVFEGKFSSGGVWMQEMYLPGRGSWQELNEVRID
ncbi:hypothetical protein GF362_04880 [Candidatus Dojkabacteria bacterium]|nr:hypothetical protein [Candidatus Dojkabacteria bacterium]